MTCAAQAPALPGLVLVTAMLLAGIAISTLFPDRLRSLPVVMVIGIAWFSFSAQRALEDRLHPALEGRDLIIEGRVISPPRRGERRVQFDFAPASGVADGRLITLPDRIRLTWYRPDVAVTGGAAYRLEVRLRQPRGMRNPGGFDYAGWLLARRYGATGYVRRQVAVPHLPDTPASVVARWRQNRADDIAALVPAQPAQAVIRALALGDRSVLTPDLWTLITATGVNHLFAISGLHIGLVGGFCFLIGRRLWARTGWAEVFPAPLAGGVLAVAGATVYAVICGFGIPARRALVMFLVLAAALLARRRLRFSDAVAVALLAVLAFDPLAVLDGGFWLSFGAVAWIGWMVTGRTAAPRAWLGWIRLQWFLCIGLAPLLLVLFGRVSAAALPANLLAVPVMSFVTIPLALGGTAALGLSEVAAAALLRLSGWSVEALWFWLRICADFAQAVPVDWAAPAWAVLPATLGAVWLLAPRGVPGRWVGLVWMLPLFYTGEVPEAGDFELTVLDVGQGLATLVKTRDHLLLYDTGARFSDRFDIGRDVVAPQIHRLGRRTVDLLIVSHGDGDHAGGTLGLLQRVGVSQIKVGEPLPDLPPGVSSTRCRAGDQWRWDGVLFQVLYPSPLDEAACRVDSNRCSCVLLVSGRSGRALLTGDIDRPAIRRLMERQGAQPLSVDLLVVPHHGSRDAADAHFASWTRPRHAIVSAGHDSRYGHPHREAVDLYRAIDSRVWVTAEHGAVVAKVRHGAAPELLGERQRRRRIWDGSS
ncbi:MAG: DNA internalization-related competence protein ComEC/Rec2, partial [Pseudomonadota bacterium]|nr:DNA internalization-related competence protein ComEC/Rec2 [Pseudomonadota bacterium]